MQLELTGMCACGCGSTNWPVPHYALDENGCWTWQRARHPDGYGSTSVRGKTRPAHRHFYEVYVGPIPKGLCIDHLCRNRACVNPAHLEVVTIAENSRRGERVALKTHCANGHPYTSENVTLKKNGDRLARICRVCKSESQGRWRRKAKQTAGFSPASTGDRENDRTST